MRIATFKARTEKRYKLFFIKAKNWPHPSGIKETIISGIDFPSSMVWRKKLIIC